MEEQNQKWHSRLTIWVVGILIFELISGLLIYFLSFSLTTQSLVVIHTAVGLVLIIPYIIYQIRHWLFYRKRLLTHHKLTGYLSMTSAVVAVVTGLVLCSQALFSTKIGYTWDTIHIISTFAFLLSVVPHILLLIIRDLRSAKNEKIKQLLDAEKRFGLQTLLVLGFQVAILVLFIYAYNPIRFNNKFPSDYQFIYGKSKPFQPSLATTNSGGAIDARLLGGSKSCMSSGCHANIGKEWEASAHRYSAMDPAFRKVQHAMAVEKGPESTRYCGGCHDPISLFSGSKNLDNKKLTNPIGLDEGISCVTCHSITKVDVKGNAAYKVSRPEPYMFELKKGTAARIISDFLIRAYPKHHVDSYERTLLKTPEFCGSCHKQFINKQVNGVGWVQLQNQYDNWRKSHWNVPHNPMKTIECRECHMPLVATYDPGNGDSLDYNRTPNDHKHRSHRFLGGNQLMPVLLHLPGGKEQVKLVNEWLKGEIQIPEIATKWHNGPAIPIELHVPASIHSGQTVAMDVTVTNNKPGHNFPTGPLDLIQAWIQLTVKDGQGNVIYSSGKLDKHHFIPPGTFVYRAEPVDQFNSVINKHNLWELVGVKFSRSLYPGFSDQANYKFKYDKSGKAHLLHAVTSTPARGDTLYVSARLCYRKFNQYIVNLLFNKGKSDITAPVTVISEDQKKIVIAPSTHVQP